MNSYICNRDGNALEYRTHEFRPGGEMFCWQCEQRTRNGLPLLPERPTISLDDIRDQAAADRASALVSAEDKRERRRIRDAARKREQEKRQRSPEWVAHLDRVRPRFHPEYVRAYWQQKAIQLGLPDVA